MPNDLHQRLAELAGSEVPWALATVMSVQGSTPGKVGAKAIFLADGTVSGTIGGGVMEAEAQRIAVEAITTGCPVVFDFDMEGSEIADREPLCGGTARVLIDPTAASHGPAYEAAAAALERCERGLLITTATYEPDHTKRKRGEPSESVRSDLRQKLEACRVSVDYVAETRTDRGVSIPDAETLRTALAQETPILLADESEAGVRKEIFVEPIIPAPRLIMAGAGHVGQAVAWQAEQVGFEVTVIDDREEFLTADRFPAGTECRCGPIAEEIRALALGPDTYVVIVTRGHQHDAEALAACIDRPSAYLGMIGSRRKVARMRQEFLDTGRASAETFDRVYAPIGLDIGAVTVPEIAASIVAQLIAVRRRGDAPRIVQR